MKRREYLEGAAVTAKTATAVGTLGAVAATAAASHMDEPGENISLTFDEAALDTYRPRLVMSTDAREKHLGTYGWYATSADYDTDVAVYWNRYSNQEGWIGPDSHFGDTEPVQIEIDSETGEVTRVRASVYHWMKGEVTAANAPLYEETHAHLAVVDPHHQHRAAQPAEDGFFPAIKDLTEHYPRWLDNDLEEDVRVGSSTVPWRMQNWDHWWQTGAGGFSKDALLVQALRTAGFDTEGQLEA